jgi:hypothetical protein
MPISHTLEEALMLYIDGKMTKHLSTLTQSQAKSRHANVYYSFHMTIEGLRMLFSRRLDDTNNSAEIKLEALLDHTIQNLIDVQCDMLTHFHLYICHQVRGIT